MIGWQTEKKEKSTKKENITNTDQLLQYTTTINMDIELDFKLLATGYLETTVNIPITYATQ